MTDIPKATHQGSLKIGELELDCYVLETGQRVFHKRGMAQALGMKSKGGNVFMRTVQRKGLGSEISPELMEKIDNPIVFKPMAGDPGHGYEADTLIEVCDAIIEAKNNEKLTASQDFLAKQAEIIIRSVAKVGIVALVDEATGYQDFRTKKALQELLEQYIAKELQPWVKTFQDDFYKEIFRLRGWPYRPDSVKRPQVVGKWTNDIVYDRLAPGVREELHSLAERDERGRPKHRLFQRLTREGGHPKLREHLASVTTLMRASSNWDQFKRLLNRSLPAVGSNLELPLGGDD